MANQVRKSCAAKAAITLILTACAIVFMLGPASGQIIGFNDLSGWTYNQADGGSPIDLPNANTVHLTTGEGQARSIFFDTKQNIGDGFTTSFIYQATSINACLDPQGIALVFQDSVSGAAAVGGGNGGIGYTGITPSAAVVLWNDTGPGLTYNGFFRGGSFGSGSTPISPANAFNHRDLLVTANYTGSILRVSIDDPTTPGVDFSRNYFVGNLASTIGSSTAYVGFTASTGDFFGNGGSNQYISNFQFSPRSAAVPELGAGVHSVLLMLLGGLWGRRMRRKAI